MKRTIVFLGGCLLATVGALAGPREMSIQQRQGELRESPNFLAPVVTRLQYGDRVSVTEESGAWTRVQGPTAAGWIHSAALTPKRIKLAAGASDAAVGATTDEIAHASKGFDREVEGAFRQKNPEIRFEWVDKMETFVVPPEEIEKFLEDGQLVAAEGGAK